MAILFPSRGIKQASLVLPCYKAAMEMPKITALHALTQLKNTLLGSGKRPKVLLGLTSSLTMVQSGWKSRTAYNAFTILEIIYVRAH